MNPEPTDDSALEALLRTPAPVLADNGFSSLVLARLPAAPAKSFFWRRALVCLVGALAGGVLALDGDASWPEIQSKAAQIVAAFIHAGPAFFDPMFGGALVVTALSLLFAFREELRARLLD